MHVPLLCTVAIGVHWELKEAAGPCFYLLHSLRGVKWSSWWGGKEKNPVESMCVCCRAVNFLKIRTYKATVKNLILILLY